LYDNIVNGKYSELDFLRTSEHYYIDTTEYTTCEVMEKAITLLK